MRDILNTVLQEIKPSKSDEKQVMDKVNSVIKRINRNMKNAKAVLGGSGAKGTWLKSFDADVFVKFNYKKYKDKSKELADVLEKGVKKSFVNYERLHGSRDYFQVKLDSFTVELIPILEIKKSKEAMNITDVSLLHVKWVKRYKKLADEIRLAKQFCKATEVYGAESYTRGLSGYVAEILVIHYGGFLRLVRNAAKWGDKEIIDPNKYYKTKNDVLFNLNAAKTVSPLILIDPVQKNRNAAASVSKEKFERFKAVCKEFLEKPSVEFFRIKEFDITELEKRKGRNKLVVFNGTALKGKKDIVGSKLLKVFEFLSGKITSNEFKIIEKEWRWGKDVMFWFIVYAKELEEYKRHEGPMVKSKRHVESFKQKHKETFVIGKRVYAKVKRKYIRIEELTKDLVKDDYVKERMEKVWLEK